MQPLSDHPYRLYASIVTARRGGVRTYVIVPLTVTSDLDIKGEMVRTLSLRLSYESVPPAEGWEEHAVYTTIDLTAYANIFCAAQAARRYSP